MQMTKCVLAIFSALTQLFRGFGNKIKWYFAWMSVAAELKRTFVLPPFVSVQVSNQLGANVAEDVTSSTTIRRSGCPS